MKKILIIGGNGYVGSFLNHTFQKDFNITNIDLNWFSSQSNPSDFKDLTKEYLSEFESIILLAGHSSVKMCQDNMISSFRNNVQNFVELLGKIDKDQKLIYAGSSSVYGHTKNSIVSEDYNTFVPNNYYDLTKQIIDTYALQIGNNVILFEIFGPIECHVFCHVRQTLLIIILHDGTCLDNEAQFHFFLRLFVLPYIIGKAIIKFTCGYFCIKRKLGAKLILGEN